MPGRLGILYEDLEVSGEGEESMKGFLALWAGGSSAVWILVPLTKEQPFICQLQRQVLDYKAASISIPKASIRYRLL